MKRAAIAAIIVFVVAGTTAVYAQHWPGRWHGFSRSTPDDMSALADARIAAIKVGLRLTADQEKFWPPVEAAARDMAKQRIDRIAARREDRRGWRERPAPDELFTRFKQRADHMAASAASMQRLSEAAEPLYRSLNDNQKRRLVMLAGAGGEHRFGARSHWRERTDFEDRRGDGFEDRRGEREFRREREHRELPAQGPERL
jgi:hypothetical protein